MGYVNYIAKLQMSSFIILLEPPGVTLSNAKDSAINIINKTVLYSLIWFH